MTNNLTIGKPAKLIIMFTLPIVLGNIFQQFYSLVDTLIVGRTISTDALAAVGSTGAVTFLVLSFIQGVTSGFAVVTGQKFGAGDHEGVRKSFAVSLMLSVIMTVLLTMVSTACARPLLSVMGTPDQILDDAVCYLQAIYLGTGAAVLYNLISNIVRALGDSRTPLIFLIISSVLNIGLDLLFILTFGMGVAGAAWATVVSQLVSGVLCVIYSLKRFPILRLKREDWKFDRELVWYHLKIGFPMGFQMSVMSIGMIAVQTALNGFGTNAIAGYTAASKVDQIAVQLNLSLGIAMSSYTAQNFGAKKYNRIRTGIKLSCLYALIFSIISAVLIFFFGKYLVALFLEQANPEVMEFATGYLNIVIPFYFALGLLVILRSALQGMGRPTMPFIGCLVELAMRAGAAFLFAYLFGYAGMCFASPTAWISTSILLVVSYVVIMRGMPKTDQPVSGV